MSMSKQNSLHVSYTGAVAPPIKKSAEEFKAKRGTEFEFTIGKAESHRRNSRNQRK
jgi:hypothetical protein